MALVHNALNRATELLRGFRAAVGLVDSGYGVERISETLVPTLNIWSGQDSPEWFALRGEKRAFGYYDLAALAGNYSMLQIYNPHQLIVVVDEIRASLKVAGDILLLYTNTQLSAGTSSTHALDRRLNRPATNIRYEQAAALVGTIFGWHSALAGEEMTIGHRMVLGFNQGIVIAPGAVNTRIIANFYWRERAFLPGESLPELAF